MRPKGSLFCCLFLLPEMVGNLKLSAIDFFDEFFMWERFTKEVALKSFTVDITKEVLLLFGFHTFGKRSHTELLRHLNNGFK